MNFLQHKTSKNLIPAVSPYPIYSYMCTWDIQCANEIPGKTMRDWLSHESLFGPNGWCYLFTPEIRKDYIFLLDDGWDLPLSVDGVNSDDHFGSFVLDPVKFPGYGDTPLERLKTMTRKVQEAGWYGLGVWVCCQEDAFHRNENGRWNEDYWIERILWSKEAGVIYWKNDWGKFAYTHEWRKFISRIANELYPDLIIEHITGDYGTNDPLDTGTCEKRIANMLTCASYSDVFRTYDVTRQLYVCTTMDRVTRILKDVQITDGDHLGLLHCDLNTHMAAAAGCTTAICLCLTESSEATYGNARGEDETIRAAHWQRIAPPFDMSAYENKVSNQILTDTWYFTPADTWDHTIHNLLVKQHAAAAFGRGVDYPVTDLEEPPFMVAARNPISGALSMATLCRTQQDRMNQQIYADVTWNVGALTGPIGLFGVYKSLTISFDRDISGLQILAQDLKGPCAYDITPFVQVNGNILKLDGELLRVIGTSAAHKNDPSEPGLVIQIGTKSDWVAPPPTLPRAKRL